MMSAPRRRSTRDGSGKRSCGGVLAGDLRNEENGRIGRYVEADQHSQLAHRRAERGAYQGPRFSAPAPPVQPCPFLNKTLLYCIVRIVLCGLTDSRPASARPRYRHRTHAPSGTARRSSPGHLSRYSYSAPSPSSHPPSAHGSRHSQAAPIVSLPPGDHAQTRTRRPGHRGRGSRRGRRRCSRMLRGGRELSRRRRRLCGGEFGRRRGWWRGCWWRRTGRRRRGALRVGGAGRWLERW